MSKFIRRIQALERMQRRDRADKTERRQIEKEALRDFSVDELEALRSAAEIQEDEVPRPLTELEDQAQEKYNLGYERACRLAGYESSAEFKQKRHRIERLLELSWWPRSR